ncbi:MAG: B12-binding domain-containing radical SAM protein [Lachnospiraceae bacterium]|nr:B12-binding domain-containing radical SAM protein [Lachnospiraceae bacterium]
MKILLTAINAKYIHSNLAVYSLRANLGEYKSYVTLKEYTINHLREEVISNIYKESPDVLVLSCYIWNIEFIRGILENIRQVLPQIDIWLGGPEVSYLSWEFLEANPVVKGIMRGEGEFTFKELVAYYVDKSLDLKDICGLIYRSEHMEIVTTRDRELCNLDDLAFAYEDLQDFEHRIIYYESSRGCPYSCAYCLSSVDKSVRFRSLCLVEQELEFFLEHQVPQVKFVDRTFNCSHKHTMGILKFIKEHDNGITNFHFEVSADIFNEDELAFLRSLRPGLVQLEIGVQSVNPDTINAIQRRTNFDTLKKNVLYLKERGNIHQHLDLIAGLPNEDYKSFSHSFNAVYELRPEQLQMGFLKVLKGAYLYEKKEEFGIVYSKTPPYEVLYTRWLSYGEVIRLKQVEEMVEVYYNSDQFTRTMEFLLTFFSNAFAMYESLGDYYENHGLFAVNHSRMARYEILLAYFQEKFCEKVSPEESGRRLECFKECLVYDLYLRENLKNRPIWAPSQEEEKESIRLFYRREAAEPRYLLGGKYEKAEEKQLYRMTHLEVFSYDVQGDFKRKRTALLFDYEKRSPLTHEAAVHSLNNVLKDVFETGARI